MQKQPDLAKNLENLFKESAYTEFKEGEFINNPSLTGYFYIFKNITDPRFCIILNTSKQQYPTNMVMIQDYVFIVFNIKDLKQYLQDLGSVYMSDILFILEQKLQKKNERNLPYGYYLDENGQLKIDPKKAQEVKKIYDRYIEIESVRDIVAEMKSNFSHIRDVLHDNEAYLEMSPKILPVTKIKKINELLAKNVKGTFRKQTTADKIKEMRKRRKEREKLQGLR